MKKIESVTIKYGNSKENIVEEVEYEVREDNTVWVKGKKVGRMDEKYFRIYFDNGAVYSEGTN